MTDTAKLKTAAGINLETGVKRERSGMMNLS